MSAIDREDELQDAALRGRAARLGVDAAGRLDVERTAQAVVERLRAKPVGRRPLWIQPTWLRIAAAIVLLLGGALVLRIITQQPQAQDRTLVVDELAELSTDELKQVLASLDQTLDLGVPMADDEEIEDLDAEQLRRALQMVEG